MSATSWFQALEPSERKWLLSFLHDALELLQNHPRHGPLRVSHPEDVLRVGTQLTRELSSDHDAAKALEGLYPVTDSVLWDCRWFVEAPGCGEPGNALFVRVNRQIELWIVRYDTWRNEHWTVERAAEAMRSGAASPVLLRAQHSKVVTSWLDALGVGLMAAGKRPSEDVG